MDINFVKKNAIYIKYEKGIAETDAYIQSTLPDLEKIRDYKELYFKVESKPCIEAYVERTEMSERTNRYLNYNVTTPVRFSSYYENTSVAKTAIANWIKENCEQHELGIYSGIIEHTATLDESSIMIINNIYKTKDGRLEVGLYVPRYNAPQVIGGTFEKGIFKISYLHQNSFYTLEEIDKMNQQIYK